MDYLKLIGLNPELAWVKFLKDHLFTILLILAVTLGSVLFYFDYKETKAGLNKANQQIALYQKTIDEQKATIKELQEKLVLASKSNDITNTAEETIVREEQSVDKDAIARSRIVEQKVAGVRAKKNLPLKEVDTEVSGVYIDDLWVGHCKRVENKESQQCADFLPQKETDSLELKAASAIELNSPQGVQP